jgi:hypothetical protein
MVIRRPPNQESRLALCPRRFTLACWTSPSRVCIWRRNQRLTVPVPMASVDPAQPELCASFKPMIPATIKPSETSRRALVESP